MVRSDYLDLAKTLAETKPANSGIRFEQWRDDCIAIAGMISNKTRAFDSKLFLFNCGYGDQNV